MKANVLVTGGAGFIGSHLVEALVARGAAVRVLDDFSSGRRENLAAVAGQIEILEGDVRDEKMLSRALEGIRIVFHLAARPSVWRSVQDPLSTHDINLTGTVKLLWYAREAGVQRFVFSSSSAVYGETPTLPKHEGLAPAPLSPYAVSKLAAENYAVVWNRLYGLKTFALRYFNVYGPRQDPSSPYAAVIPRFLAALRQGQPPTIYGDGEQSRDFTFVSDAVAANLCCLDAPPEAAGHVYNVARGERVTINELARLLACLWGSSVSPVHVDPRPGDIRHSQADIARARRWLGWAPRVGLEEGLRRTVEWFAKT